MLWRVSFLSKQNGIVAIMPQMFYLLRCHMNLQRYVEVSLATFFIYMLTICDNFGVRNLLLMSKINTRSFVLHIKMNLFSNRSLTNVITTHCLKLLGKLLRGDSI